MRLPALLLSSCLALPALGACSSQSESPPLTKEALAAVAKSPGAPTKELAREVDDLFTKQGLGETRALVVMHGGYIAAERYAPGYGPKTRFVSWSMAKTVTAVMIGMLIADGRLRLDESPPIPRWLCTMLARLSSARMLCRNFSGMSWISLRRSAVIGPRPWAAASSTTALMA